MSESSSTASAPTTAQVLYPAQRYRDAHAAIAWLCDAFGFERQMLVDDGEGGVAHAQLTLDGAVFMLGSAREVKSEGGYPARTPAEVGAITGSIYVHAADPDAHCVRARAAGATIVAEPHDTEYGSREYAARDPEGYWWTFGTYRP